MRLSAAWLLSAKSSLSHQIALDPQRPFTMGKIRPIVYSHAGVQKSSGAFFVVLYRERCRKCPARNRIALSAFSRGGKNSYVKLSRL
jgi:hypothetical protein